MKKVLKNVSFIFLLLKTCFIFGQETVIQKRIPIDKLQTDFKKILGFESRGVKFEIVKFITNDSRVLIINLDMVVKQ